MADKQFVTQIADINENFTDIDAGFFAGIDNFIRALGKMIAAFAQPILKTFGVA